MNLQNPEKKLLLDIINSGLIGDIPRLELAAISLSRRIRSEDSIVAAEITECLTRYSLGGGSFRSNSKPIPKNSDNELDLAGILPPDDYPTRPILDEHISKKIDAFLNERFKIQALLERNVRPSNSLILTGAPGTGKTMIAKYIASFLKKDLVILDLSSSISSLLGKTGENLKKVLDYAKNSNTVLLLDEFDAIAKRRDDSTDLGEIKRVVNVLLMELENWPLSSIVIATSNHPELLDKAIWRRFDHSIQLEVPAASERLTLLQQELADFDDKSSEMEHVIKIAGEILDGQSSAEICKICNNIKRRIILDDLDGKIAILSEVSSRTSDNKAKAKLCNTLKEYFKEKITVREIAALLHMSPSGVQHHLSKNK